MCMRLDCAVCFGGQHQSFYSHTAWSIPHCKRLSTNLNYVHMMTVLTLRNRNEHTCTHTHTRWLHRVRMITATCTIWFQMALCIARSAIMSKLYCSSKSWSTFKSLWCYIAGNHWGPCNLPLLLWILRTQVLTDDQKQTLFCSIYIAYCLPSHFLSTSLHLMKINRRGQREHHQEVTSQLII